MGRHRDAAASVLDSGRQTTVIIGAVGVLAVALVFGAWWMLSASPSIGASASAMSTARVTLNNLPAPTDGATADPTETFVVPTPSFSTPTLAVALGSREPEIPGETATLTLPAYSPPASSSTTTPPSGGRVTVGNLSLVCNLQGRRVRATLTFVSNGAVPVSLTAGDRTENSVASGNVRLDVVGNAPDSGTATCSAKVNGMSVGPIAGS